MVKSAYAATNVYYSVGQSTDNLETDGGNVTVSGTTATFTVAQTGNIGVGDKVTYDTDKTCYISGKTSSTVWSCVSATGSIPTAASGVDVVSIKRAFTSLSAAEAGAPALLGSTSDLVAGNYVLNLPCYYDNAADTTAVTIDGWTTSADNYIKIYTPQGGTESNSSQRHSGKWDEGKYRLEFSVEDPMAISVNNFRLEGILMKHTYSGSSIWGPRTISIGVDSAVSDLRFSNNFFEGNFSGLTGSAGVYFIDHNYGATVNEKFNNNIFTGFISPVSSDSKVICFCSGGQSQVYLYNNTIYNASYGFNRTYDAHLHAKNNIAQNVIEGFSGNSFETDSDYNLSSVEDDAPGTHSKNSTTVSFLDAANQDFHLANTDTSARGNGTNLGSDAYLSFQNDIDGEERSGNWSIGADQYNPGTIQTEQSESITDGLVLYQSFDGQYISGTTALDRSGNGYNGTISAAIPTIGKFGQALNFNGTSSFIYTDNSAKIEQATQITVSAWIKTDFDSGDWDEIVTDFGASTNDCKWWLGINNSDATKYIEFGIQDPTDCASTYNVDHASRFNNPTPGVWHHLVGTYDTDDVKLYVDGAAPVIQHYDTAGMNATCGGVISVGQLLYGLNWYFYKGLIDEVRVYDRALSAAEVGDLYRLGQDKINSGQVGNINSGLVLHQSFDGQYISGTTALDSSGQGNNGLISGATPAIGKNGQALLFDGTDDKFETESDVTFSTGVSFSFWMKGSPGAYGTTVGGTYVFCVAGNIGNKITCVADGDSSGSATSSLDVLDGNWHHIVFTSTSNAQTIYVDGSNDGSATETLSTDPRHIGVGNRPSSEVYYAGLIDEVRVYNRALSAQEIGDLYRLGQATIKR